MEGPGLGLEKKGAFKKGVCQVRLAHVGALVVQFKQRL